MKVTRETFISIGLVTLLIAVTVFAALAKGIQSIPYLSTSSDPNGALALNLWLDELGFKSFDTANAIFQPPASANLILILEPLYEITDSDFKLLDKWVEDGGTLVLAGSERGAYVALAHYEFYLRFLTELSPALSPQTPLLTSPALADAVNLRADSFFYTARTDFVTHLAVPEGPILVSFEQGRGRVILSASAYPFSNIGLKEDANARLVLNLVGLADEIKVVWFDEWHHGIRSASVVGPEQWLRQTPGGHSVLFAAAVIFVALLIQGRGFGRPLPLAYELRRRGPLEHVNAISNLNRKAGHRASVLQRYRHDIKRAVGKRYRLDPSLPDEEYVAQLVKFSPSLDGAALLTVLQHLGKDKVSESEMVKLAEQASRWIGQAV